MSDNIKSFMPALPDLAGRLPGLDTAALNQGEHHMSLDEQRLRWGSLAWRLVGLVAWPWLCWKLVGLEWLGLVDGLALAVVGLVALGLGVAWALISYRQELIRERLRYRRAALENRLMEQGYATFYAGYDQAVRRTYGRPAPNKDATTINYDAYRDDLAGLRGKLDDLAGALGERLDQVAARVVDAVTVDQVDGPTTQHLPVDPGVAVGYYNSPLEGLIARIVRGQDYGLRALTMGDVRYMSRSEYEGCIERLAPVGVLMPVKGRPAQLAPELLSWRAKWGLADADQDKRALEDAAHAWVVGRLGGGEVARVAPSPTVQ